MSGLDKTIRVSSGWSECILHVGKKWKFVTKMTRRALSVKIPSLPFLSIPMGQIYLPAIDFRLCPFVLANEMLLDMTWAETREVLVLLSLLSCFCCGHEKNMGPRRRELCRAAPGDPKTYSLKQSHPHWPSGIGWEILPVVSLWYLYFLCSSSWWRQPTRATWSPMASWNLGIEKIKCLKLGVSLSPQKREMIAFLGWAEKVLPAALRT